MKKENRLKRRKQKKQPNQLKKFVKIILGVVLIIVLAWGFATVYHQYNRSRNVQLQSQIDTVQNGQSKEFKQISPDVPLYVLIIGVDDNYPSQTNFVGVAAINKDKKHIDFIMLPDNTKIEGRKEKGAQRLCDIYTEGGLKLTQAVVEDIFHIPIPFYVVCTQDSFTSFINAYGDFSMYVEKDMYHEDANGKTDIDLKQGYQSLDGEKALGYMRFIDADGYLSRAERQERFVKLFYTAMESHFGVTNAFHMHKIWGTMESNISSMDMAKLAFAFRNVPVSDIKFYMLPGELSHHQKDVFWTYDPIEVQKIIGSTNNAIASNVDTAKN